MAYEEKPGVSEGYGAVNVVMRDTAKPSYQHWIDLSAEQRREALRALRARREMLEARQAEITLEANEAEYRDLTKQISAEHYFNALPYDPATLSYAEWAALPEEEQLQVIVALKKRAADMHPRYLAMTDAEQAAYDAEHHALVGDLITQQKMGVVFSGSIVLGKGHTIRVSDDGAIRAQPPLRYNPADLFYKEWMALPRDEQWRVMEMLRAHPAWLEARFAAMTPEEHDAEFQSLMKDVRAEEERTRIIRPGWIVIGKGRRMHRLIRKVPAGWAFG